MTIERFDGDYAFLSNFHPAPFTYDGLYYCNAENAYQAAKSDDPDIRKLFCMMSPGQAKRQGQLIELRKNWDLLKIAIMCEIVTLKFVYNPGLKHKLIATGDAELIEGNYWGDTFWGVCKGKGTNHLGQILMRVRSLLRNDRSNESSFRDSGVGI